jgi:hypothetical protein
VYFTKVWTKKNLFDLSEVMREILDLQISSKKVRLYGFQENM